MQCAVCGDKAYGCNFGAITCESCKSFYRRHAHKHVDFQCPSDGTCNINKLTRKYCPGCRMKKCFTVGMTRPFREAACSTSATAVTSSTMPDQPFQQVTKVEASADSLHTSQVISNANVSSPTSSSSPSDQRAAKVPYKRKIKSTENEREADACATSSSSDIKQINLHPLAPEVCTSTIASSHQQTFIDLKHAIIGVLNFMDAPFTEGELTRRDQTPASVSRAVISYMESALRRAVCGLKRLPDFVTLPQSTQVFALRRNLLEFFQFFSLLNVNEANTGWVARTAEGLPSIPANFYDNFIEFGLQFNIDFRPYTSRYKKFVQDIREAFPRDWRFMTILLCIIVTFSMKYDVGAANADVWHANAMYEKYLRFLESYLRVEYSAQMDAKLSFVGSILEQVREVAELNAITITHLLTGVPPPPPTAEDSPSAVCNRATTTVAPLLAEAVLHLLDDPPGT